ncbi:MAG: ABC transporter substrate-binding protein [Candidatus Bipolaricaulota bacterium]|nr:ABC transporter substrate-binding protein [Candidatus Bipolaricaulota bacterium]MCS7274664.1 ABC transporter substrate-binding protein [Candidatus Bipolaricaulota bacterium]MDW8111491.1 ABC transporter substrate-binding protein [Candidatus Bipolaricaulota bacterium]MDW8329625.1 ABC transporter substrate-binding protein [Candidatus Bipolaricaulota bacterium]
MTSQWSRRTFLRALGCGATTALLAQTLGWGQAPVRVGLIGPIDLLDVGRAMLRGALIAQDEINRLVDERKLPPPKLSFDGLVRDDQVLRGDVARAAFEDIVQRGAVAVFGGFLDEAVAGIFPALARLRKPFLNTGTTAKEFSRLVKEEYDRYKYYFRVMINSEVLAQEHVDMSARFLVKELGVQKVVLLFEDSAYGRDSIKILEERLPKAGIGIAKSFVFPVNNPDFAAILQQIADTDADALIPGFAFNNGIPFVGQAFETKLDMPVFGVIVEGQSFEYWRSTGGRVMGHTYADAATGETPITPKTRPFYQSYVERYGETQPSRPLYTAFTTYDAVYVFKEALDRARGSTDADRLVEELEKTDYIGTVGRLKFRDRTDIYPHDPIYGPDYVVAKWVLWTTTARDPRDARAEPQRVVVWPPQFRLRADAEGRPVSINECIARANEEYKKQVEDWKRQGRPRGRRFEHWQNWARAVARCFAG